MTNDIKPYLIVIYGKDGCDKCALLKRRVSSLLAKGNQDFDLDYQNLSTAEGMAAYALAETVNGQRIPAMQIMRYNEDRKTYVKIPDPRPEVTDSENGRVFVPVYLQIQTDYASGSGVITPADVTRLMVLAREAS
jgi:glutaredoxin